MTQGSSFLPPSRRAIAPLRRDGGATLGNGPESRWDSPSAQRRACKRGGLGNLSAVTLAKAEAHRLFGEQLLKLLGELNEGLAA